MPTLIHDKSEDFKSINDALFHFQQEVDIIRKDAENPYHNSMYADLPGIWKVIKPLLLKYKLLVTHSTSSGDNYDYLLTEICHVPSGESTASTCRIYLQKGTAQEYGSCLTYMRRYQVAALLGLIMDDDDDGNAASAVKPVDKKPELKKAPVKKEPEQKEFPPLTGEEFRALQDMFRTSKTLEELKVTFDKMKAAKSRMTKEQYHGLVLVKDKKKGELNGTTVTDAAVPPANGS